MKLKLEHKLQIIELYKNGISLSKLTLMYKLNPTTIKSITRQYRTYGIIYV